jgi:WD repeat-containing protein 92
VAFHRRYHYPAERAVKDDSAEGSSGGGIRMRGVPGTVELLNARIITSQPIVSWDWSPDKEGLAVASCLDQTLRVLIVTKLHKY